MDSPSSEQTPARRSTPITAVPDEADKNAAAMFADWHEGFTRHDVDQLAKAMDDVGILSFDDAYHIGAKIAEMADRVKIGNMHTPGAQCKWVFEMDDVKYNVVVSVARHQSGRTGAGEALREALAEAYRKGATDVHSYWVNNPGEPPRGDPEFGEAASDYATAALDLFDSSARAALAQPVEAGEDGT